MFSHHWWHLALVIINQGNSQATLGFYDLSIWVLWKEYSQKYVSAVSLLVWLELVSVDVGNRWADIGEYLKTSINERVQPFLSIKYL